MHKITFFPLGNADCCKIDLENGKKLLFDYAHYRDAEDNNDPRIDLAGVLREELKKEKRDNFDVVAFTHADDDHIHAFSDFFYLQHAKQYQSDDRVKIKELWVPSAVIIEEGATGEADTLRAEARYLLEQGKDIRVFSRPDRLKEWLEGKGIKPEDRSSLITDAGTIAPGYSIDKDGVEFFVHSPFAKHVDDGLKDRNEAALILHTTFSVGNEKTRLMLVGDTTYDILSEIVQITKFHEREERLNWDVYDIPHHCSSKALNSDENKGKDKTEPTEDVQWLLDQGNKKGKLISCSDPIPGKDTEQPPHMQAASTYKEAATKIEGEFLVTMEHKSTKKPEPLVIDIDKTGAIIRKTIIGGGAAAIHRTPPRAG